jgi:hypothetical protein
MPFPAHAQRYTDDTKRNWPGACPPLRFFCALTPKGHTMAEKRGPERRGQAKTLTLDDEAVLLLDALCLGRHSQGRVVSNLLREELARREERLLLRDRILAAIDPRTDPVAR